MLRKSTPAAKTGRVSAAGLGTLLCAIAHTTTAAGGDFPDALFPGAALPEESTHVCLDGGAVQPANATAYVRGQDRVFAAQYHPVVESTPRASAPHDASLSDLLTRLDYAFGSDVGLSSDRARQKESEVLLKNSNAFVRAKIPVTLGREWRGFLYADVSAKDSALRWQGLVGIRGGHGVNVLGGWRHVTYHFNDGSGFDSHDFDGPFLGATLTW